MELLPFHEIKVSEIIKVANVNRGTFYNHYDSKETLLYEIIDETLEEMKKQFRKPYEQLERVDFHAFPKVDISVFHFLREQSRLFNVLLKEATLFDLHHFIADTIEELYIEECLFKLNNDNVHKKWFYVYSANGMAAIIMRWIETGYVESPEAISIQTFELMKTCALGFKRC